MFFTKEYLKSIKPAKNGESDKYSWRMWRYLSKYKNLQAYKNKDGKIIIGGKHKNEEAWSGINLNTLIRFGGKYETFCFLGSLGWSFTEIPNFFEDYQKIGRCLFTGHGETWIVGGKNRYGYTRNTRKCKWCGKWFNKSIEKETKIVRVEKWKEVKTKAR